MNNSNTVIYFTWGIIGLFVGIFIPLSFVYADLYQLEMAITLKNSLWVIQSQNILTFSVFGFPIIFISMGILIAVNQVKKNRITYNERYLNRIVNTITDQIVLLDRYGNMSSYNESFMQKTLYSEEELDSIFFNNLLIEPWAICLKNIFSDTRVYNTELNIVRKDKTIFPAIFSAAPLTLKGSKILYVCIIKDIQEIKQMEHDLELEREKSAHNLKLQTLGEMAAGVAHEINNPLTIIKSYIFLIQKKIAPQVEADRELKSNMKSIRTGADRIAKIISGLKSFSRDGSKDPFAPISLETILDDTLNLLQKNFENANIVIDTSEIENNIVIECQAVQICQIMVNLLTNAKDAVLDNSDKWIKIKARKDTQHAYISVVDSGNGIPTDIQENIHRPFFTTKEVGSGTGLGLSLCKGIADKHLGRLDYVQEAENTTFTLKLPLKSAGKLNKAIDEANEIIYKK